MTSSKLNTTQPPHPKNGNKSQASLATCIVLWPSLSSCNKPNLAACVLFRIGLQTWGITQVLQFILRMNALGQESRWLKLWGQQDWKDQWTASSFLILIWADSLKLWRTYKEFKAEVDNQLQVQYSKPEFGQTLCNCQLKVKCCRFQQQPIPARETGRQEVCKNWIQSNCSASKPSLKLSSH